MIVRGSRRAMLVALAVVLALASGLLPAVAAVAPGWRVQATIAMMGKDVDLSHVAADAPNDAWAVGWWVKGEGAPVPLVAHWNGSAWRRVALPAVAVTALTANGPFYAVGASSPRNVWAFGLTGEWLHWNGARWTFGQLLEPRLNVRVDSALVISPRNVWAFGFRLRSDSTVPYAAHFNGARWIAVSVPGAHVIVAASAVSARDIWVLSGFSPVQGGEPGSLEHWRGGKWRSVPVPKPLSANLDSLVVRSDSDVWVGSGIANAKQGLTEAVGHWNGHRWAVTPMPTPATKGFMVMGAMAPDGTGGLWAAAGSNFVAVGRPTLWHYAHGHWRQSSLRLLHGLPPESMARVPRSKSVWGVGSISQGSGENGLIELAGPLPH